MTNPVLKVIFCEYSKDMIHREMQQLYEQLFGTLRGDEKKHLMCLYLIKEEIDFIATCRTSKIKYNFLSFARLLIDVGRSMITGSVKCTLIQMKVSPQEAIKHNSKTGFAQLLPDKNVCTKRLGLVVTQGSIAFSRAK